MTDEEIVYEEVKRMVEERKQKKLFPYYVMTADLSHRVDMSGARMKAALNNLFFQNKINAHQTLNDISIEII